MTEFVIGGCYTVRDLIVPLETVVADVFGRCFVKKDNGWIRTIDNRSFAGLIGSDRVVLIKLPAKADQ